MRLAAAAVLMLVVAGAAFAATRSGGPLVTTPGKETWKTNQLVRDTRHFAPATITVPSGGTVTFKDSVGHEPHTVTISTKKDLARSFNGPCRPCQIASKHLKNPNSQNSPVALAPKGPHKSASIVISAPAGTTLYYMCAFHPWMQGKIVVT